MIRRILFTLLAVVLCGHARADINAVYDSVDQSGVQASHCDRSVEGFPVRVASLDGARVTCETTLKHVGHNPIDTTLPNLPAGCQKQEMMPPK